MCVCVTGGGGDDGGERRWKIANTIFYGFVVCYYTWTEQSSVRYNIPIYVCNHISP